MSQIRLDKEELLPRRSAHPLLEVSNLSMRFKSRSGIIRRREFSLNAIENASFNVDESEILAVVGESGSGKTTLARCIAGLATPTSGTIRFDGVKVNALRGARLRDYHRSVQLIHQDPFESLVPRHSVFTALSIPLRKLLGIKEKKEIRERVARLLEEVDLDSEIVIDRYPHQLSGGQRQRVNIARALAPDPKLIVADEPITMLDAAQRLNILALLMELKRKRNLTVIFITHDLASAKLLCQRTIVMYLGRFVELGNTNAILSSPNHPYVELLLDSVPDLAFIDQPDKNPKAIIEESMRVTKGCVFQPRCPYWIEECKVSEPLLLEKSPDHFAACHNPLNYKKTN